MQEKNKLPIILVDDEEHIRLAAGQALELGGYDVSTYETVGRGYLLLTATCRVLMVWS